MKEAETGTIFKGSGFIFVRHGESAANRDGIIAGSLDSPLTDLGRAQAEGAARLLETLRPACIWASGASRAGETARIIGARFSLVPVLLEGLWERDWGRLEGEPIESFAGRSRTDTPPGGEGLDDFRARTLKALGGICGPYPVLVVAHSGTFRVLREVLLGGDRDDQIPNGEPYLFSRDPGGWTGGPIRPFSCKPDTDLTGN